MVEASDQYRIISATVGLVDRSERGRLRIGGADAVSFLQALLTNDLRQLERGAGIYAAYLTPQGRMIADLRLYHQGDHLMARVAPGVAAGLASTLDQLIFTEDVSVADVSAEFAELTVFGHQAATVAAGAAGIEATALAALPPLSSVRAGDALVIRADDLDVPVFDVVVPVAAVDGTQERLRAAGATPVESSVFESFRISAGRPVFGVDMTEETIPLEAGLLERGISTEKGCYVGQEVIIRVLHRGGGRVAKRLMRLSFDSPDQKAPATGATLSSDGREVGHLTSVAPAPSGSGFVALGYVHRDSAIEGQTVDVDGRAGTLSARIEGPAG